MYYKNRAEAGRLIADRLKKYTHTPCVVLALSEGGVLVGAQISLALHAKLMLLLSEKIVLPGEHEAIAALTTDTFGYRSDMSESEIDHINSEFHGIIDGQRLEKRHALNRVVSDDIKVKTTDLRDKIIIAVSDGFNDALPLDILEDFIKPIRIKRLIVATPITNVKALDKMHLLADELVVLNVREDLISVDHHYEENNIPDHEGLVKIIRNIVS